MSFGKFRTYGALVVVGLVSTLSACALPSPSATYIGDDKLHSYAKAPSGYVTESVSASPEIRVESFHARGSVGLESLDPAPTRPAGVLIRRTVPKSEDLPSQAADIFLVDFESSVKDRRVRILSQSEVLIGGVTAKRTEYSFSPGAEIDITVIQTVFVDEESLAISSIVVGCTTTCFRDQRRTIERMINTWKVGE